MLITYDDLMERGACADGLADFFETYGNVSDLVKLMEFVERERTPHDQKRYYKFLLNAYEAHEWGIRDSFEKTGDCIYWGGVLNLHMPEYEAVHARHVRAFGVQFIGYLECFSLHSDPFPFCLRSGFIADALESR